MTIDHPLRRALARVCSTATMSRVVDPIFADMRWEDGRASLRGCVALAKALTLHGVTSLPRWCAGVLSDDDHAMPRAAGFVVVGAVLVGVLLIAPALLRGPHMRGMSPVSLAILLVPQAFALSLPLAIIVAVPLALRRRPVNARLIRRMLLLSGLVAVMTFALITWALPEANQAFRVATYRANGGRPVNLTRGPMETGWTTLRHQIQDLRRTKGGGSAAASLEYAYQLRLAIVVAAVPLGFAGVAIATCGFGRRRPLITAVGVSVGYWGLLMIQESTAKTLMNTGGFFPQYLCPWTPNIIVLLMASALIYSSMPPEPSTPA